MKQILSFILLSITLFCCKRPDPEIYVKYMIVYRDTCDSEFISKIGQIETGNIDSVSGENGAGKGRYGIYEIAVIGSGLKSLLNYNHSDMHSKECADPVFWAMMGIFSYLHWQKYGQPPTFEDLARKWAGGPDGDKKAATLKYLQKFVK